MFGRGGAPIDQQVRYLEGEIGKLHLELAALHHQREDAVACEVRAMAMIDAAHALKNRCDRLINERLEAITSLRGEIDGLIPQPRTGD